MYESYQLIQAIKKDKIIPNKELIIKRNEFIISEGQVEKHIYLILEGAVRVFYINGLEEHSIRFGYKDSVITSLASFMNGSPSELFIQAIRKTKLLSISKDNFNSLIQSDNKRLIQYKNLLEELVVQQMDREIDLLTYSPTERYQRVFERSPQLFQEIPLKYIASYLRMTPETLSRIRKV